MNDKHLLFIVDDDAASRRLAELTFGQFYEVEVFASGQECLERLAEKAPDLFMLDVEMPGMDGYALCSRIREEPSRGDIPIIFVSAHNDLDARLAGYDAGGDDFIVKPVNFSELRQKVELLLRTREEHEVLQQQLNDSETLTSLILANLDEYAVLVKFLRNLNGCEELKDVADAVLDLLGGYHLEGAVQFRLPAFELTLNRSGEVSPLEASIINQVRLMGGSVSTYRNRAAFNYERISVIVNNMPLADPDLCGRLRDNLAIAIETADSRIHAILTHQENQETKSEIAGVLQSISGTVHAFREKYESAHTLGTEKIQQITTDLESEFASLGMREIQENSIKELVQVRAGELVELFDFRADTEATLNSLLERLGQRIPIH